MGDRTWLQLEFCKCDIPEIKMVGVLEKLLGEPEEQWESDLTVTFEWNEVNYAGYDQIVELTKHKYVFLYRHGDGGEYQAHVGVSDEAGVRWELPYSIHYGEIAIPIDLARDPMISNEWIERITNYRQALEKFNERSRLC